MAAIVLGIALTVAACAGPGGQSSQAEPTPAQPSAAATLPTATLATQTDPLTPTAPEPTPLPPRDWTILYYGSADHESPGFIWDDLNEMEAAAGSERITVLATVDWPTAPYPGPQAVRYVIVPGDDPAVLSSQPVANLGEANFGDPAVLANFVGWGISSYPAARYALILPGYGGGRAGCCLDRSVGLPDQSDHLSLTDIAQAINLAQMQTGIDRLDVIALGGSLLGQLDVAATIQSTADYIVASPTLVPGEGWEMRSVLGRLAAEPTQDGQQLAAMLVTEFGTYHRQLLGNEFAAMSAIETARLPDLIGAVNTLGTTLHASGPIVLRAAGDARRAAQVYGAAAIGIGQSSELTQVDLRHAASVLTAFTSAQTQFAAAAVTAAVDAAVVARDFGLGLPYAGGIGIYWPSSLVALDPSYSQISPLTGWSSFLNSFTAAAVADQPPYTATFGDAGQIVAAGQPAVLTAEVSGQQLSQLVAIAGEQAGEGRYLLHQHETLPAPTVALAGGARADFWEDGRHESLLVWDSVSGYLYDAAGTAENTLLQTVHRTSDRSLLVAHGLLARAGSADSRRATLEFPMGNAVASHIWADFPVMGGRLIGEIRPAEGDSFQPYRVYREADGRLTTEPGATLLFDRTAAIYRSARPLSIGTYTLGIAAATLDGKSSIATRDVAVGSVVNEPGYRTHVAGEFQIRFAHPDSWSTPVIENGVLFTSNISNTKTLQIRRFPDWQADLATLQSDVLATFGEISVLFQEPSRVGGLDNPESLDAIKTVYGYTSADSGQRIGSFLTFIKDGVGYLVDLDGPGEMQVDTLDTLATIADSLRFLDFAPDQKPEVWTSAGLGDYQLSYPASLSYQEHNGWHRFSGDGQTFIALRIQPAARSPEEAVAALLQTASQNVAGFSPTEIRSYYLNGAEWTRSDFGYTGSSAPIRGVILVRQDGRNEVAVWAEAPDGRQPDVLTSVFLPMAAGIKPRQ